MGAALHGLLQVWDELVSGLEQIQTSPEGLDVVFASSPNHNMVLEGSWRRPFVPASVSPFPKSLQQGWGGLCTGTWGLWAFLTLQDTHPALAAGAACTPRCRVFLSSELQGSTSINK